MENKNKKQEEVVDVLGVFEIYDESIDILNSTKKVDSVEFDLLVNANLKDTFEEKLNETSLNSPDTLHKDILKEESINPSEVTNLKNKSFFSTFLSYLLFSLKYGFTSVVIFAVLLFGTNYKVYIELVNSYLHPEENHTQSILTSVNAAKIETPVATEIQKKTKKERVEELSSKETAVSNKEDRYSIKSMVAKTNSNIDLNIELMPYENRIIIPKVGKNIPLMDVKDKNIESENELNDIFMKELEDGVVRYPGSAVPGENGNTFIFGHSSNFPWIPGKYNDVFSSLGNLKENDEVIAYYGQKKYTYIIKEKKVISPKDVGILQRNKDKSEITLMTCWPLGTTLNRLILIGELKK